MKDKLAALFVVFAAFFGGDALCQTSRVRYEASISGSLLIGPDGKVTSVEIQESAPPKVAEWAREVIGSWQFTPPTSNGRPVDASTFFQAVLVATLADENAASIEISRDQFSDRPFEESLGMSAGKGQCLSAPPDLDPPSYPSRVVRQGIGGVVELQVLTNAYGRVVSAQPSGGRVFSAAEEMSQTRVDEAFERLVASAVDAAKRWRNVACATTVIVPVTFTPPQLNASSFWKPVHHVSDRFFSELTTASSPSTTHAASGPANRGYAPSNSAHAPAQLEIPSAGVPNERIGMAGSTSPHLAPPEVSTTDEHPSVASSVALEPRRPAFDAAIQPGHDDSRGGAFSQTIRSTGAVEPSCAALPDRYVDGVKVASFSCNSVTLNMWREDSESKEVVVLTEFINEKESPTDVGPHLISPASPDWKILTFEDHVSAIRRQASSAKFWTAIAGTLGAAGAAYGGGDTVTTTETGRFRARTNSGILAGHYSSTSRTVDSSAATRRIDDIAEDVEDEFADQDARSSHAIEYAREGYLRRHTLEPGQSLQRYFVVSPRSRRPTQPLTLIVRIEGAQVALTL